MLLRHRVHCSLWVGWCGGGGHLYIKTWKHDTYSLNVYKTHSILVLIYSKHCFTFGISNLFTELDEGELAIESDSNTYKFCSSILIFSTHHWQIWQNHQRMMVRNKFGFFFSFGVPRCSPGWSGKWSLSDQCAKFKYPMFMWNCSKNLKNRYIRFLFFSLIHLYFRFSDRFQWKAQNGRWTGKRAEKEEQIGWSQQIGFYHCLTLTAVEVVSFF